MKNKQIVTIAENTHTSTATVSKVLNHCHGVSSDIRELVYREYDRLEGKRKEEKVAIYVILPETPSYFWNCEYPAPLDDTLSIKYNIYSRLGDDAMVMRYLRQAIQLKTKVIVIAARLNDEMPELLATFAQTGLVLYLNEYNDTFNSCYVGSDPSEDGYRLAELCLRHIDSHDRLLVIRNKAFLDSSTERRRYDAFAGSVMGMVALDVVDMTLPIATPLLASLLAREMTTLFQQTAYTKVVCLSGFTYSLCLAVQKMKLPFAVQCFGFEDAPQNEKFADLGLLKGAVCQDFGAQLAETLKLAQAFVQTQQYPSRRFFFISSRMVEY